MRLTINSTIDNNGGPVTLLGNSAGILQMDTAGHDMGTFTINGEYTTTYQTILKLGINNALTTNQNLTLTKGIFDLAGFSQTVSNFTASANSALLFSVNKTNAAATNGYFIVNGTASVSGGALTVSNIGPAFQVGDRIKLFNQGVSGFSSINLPPGYNWVNKLAFDGSIQVGTGVPATYYVSPAGADTNPGTLGAPFQTLAAASVPT